MATNQPLLATDPPEGCVPKCKDKMKQGGKKCIMYSCALLVVLFAIACVAQGIIYAGVTVGCGPKAIGDDYSFPGGGKSANGTAADNLIPQLSLLVERKKPDSLINWGWAMDLLPATDASSTAGAPTGTFWRNGGILWYTYTYEDIANSKLTMYMRKRFWMPWMSYTIARCDGKGPTYYFTEGSNWFNNKIRRLFSMNQAQTYQLYADSEQLANVAEVDSISVNSLTLNDIATGGERGSSILKDRQFHGDLDEWFISNKYSDPVPYFVLAAMTLPTAYDLAQIKLDEATDKAASKKAKEQPKTFLIQNTKTGLTQTLPVPQLHQSAKTVKNDETTKKVDVKGDVKLQHV